jgi:hypothetical protein
MNPLVDESPLTIKNYNRIISARRNCLRLPDSVTHTSLARLKINQRAKTDRHRHQHNIYEITRFNIHPSFSFLLFRISSDATAYLMVYLARLADTACSKFKVRLYWNDQIFFLFFRNQQKFRNVLLVVCPFRLLAVSARRS